MKKIEETNNIIQAFWYFARLVFFVFLVWLAVVVFGSFIAGILYGTFN